MSPGVKHRDRVIDLCAKHELCTIIDLHALPGCQNHRSHSDNPTHVALFWQLNHFKSVLQNPSGWLDASPS